MWIQNVSLDDIVKAWHYDPGENSILISIVDPDMEHPRAKYSFKERHNFKFFDVDSEQEHSITNEQANTLAQILIKAKQKHSNVVVHCVAGICRSGAIVECGVALGFEDTQTLRIPNVLVKTKILNCLINNGAL